MATSQESRECWESLTKADLNLKDSATVERIEALLRAALGPPNETVSIAKAPRALEKLYDLTFNVIRIKCRNALGLRRDRDGGDHPDVIALGDRIFMSHATAEPFINSQPYKTWLENWQPEKGSFLALVLVTSTKRCWDWLRSQGRDPNNIYFTSLEALDIPALDFADGSNPETAFEYKRIEALLDKALNQMPPSLAKDAFIAVEREFMSIQDYAKQSGIADNTAHGRLNTARRALAKYFIDNGIVEVGFCQNLTTAKSRGKDSLRGLSPSMTRNDI